MRILERQSHEHQRAKQRAQQSKQIKHMMCTPKALTLYSLTGTLFLLLVYTLLSTQPFFIRGINDENIEQTKSSAFGALMLFTASMVLSSMVLLWKTRCTRRRRGRGEEDGGGSLYDLIDDASQRSL